MIALFDSGLGGLSVMREVRELLPQHDLLYFADSAHCPYGPKPIAFVRERSLTIGRWLAGQGAALIVVACNTASSVALEAMRAEISMPIVGMEPGLKPAIAATRSGRVGILATSNTLRTARFAALVQRFANGIEVLTQPCPGWVEQVEAGEISGSRTRALVEQYVTPLTAQGADTLVLGCTHYPFLRPLIEEIVDQTVTIIDTGPAVARQVARVAAQHKVGSGRSHIRCITNGNPAAVAPVMRRLLDASLRVEHAAV
jgi:glutamate racemase